jgi:hypothetical protein
MTLSYACRLVRTRRMRESHAHESKPVGRDRKRCWLVCSLCPGLPSPFRTPSCLLCGAVSSYLDFRAACRPLFPHPACWSREATLTRGTDRQTTLRPHPHQISHAMSSEQPASAASSPSGDHDSVSALPSPGSSSSSSAGGSRKPQIRGHRPSIMGSVDMADESRDTVEMKDSDTWYPQFSPSAALPKAQKLSGEKQTGQARAATTSQHRERERKGRSICS